MSVLLLIPATPVIAWVAAGPLEGIGVKEISPRFSETLQNQYSSYKTHIEDLNK